MREKQTHAVALLTVAMLLGVGGGGMLMSFDTADAFSGDFYGSGTVDDPYGGTIHGAIPHELDGCFFLVGTTFTGQSDSSLGTLGGYIFPEECGISVPKDGFEDVEGVLTVAGTFDIYEEPQITGMPNRYFGTFYVVEPIEELEFISDPVSNGVIEYAV